MTARDRRDTPTVTAAPPRLDRRRPFVLDTRDLGRRPGAMAAMQLRVPAPADLSGALVGVPEGAPLALDLRLESVVEGVLVSGTVTAAVVGQCSRCLEPVRDSIEVSLQELFAYPASTTDATTDDDEVSHLVGDLLDLEPVLRDAVVLGLPLRPVCAPDCAGLCPDCGERLAELPDDHSHDRGDPRWAALADYPIMKES